MTESSRTIGTLIVGAGYVGSVLALLLKRAGHNVVLLEKAPENQPAPENRHFGVASETRQLLQHLGLWESLATQCTEIATMQISTSDAVVLNLGDGDHPLGYMVPFAYVHDVLRAALREANIEVIFGSGIKALCDNEAHSAHSTLRTDCGRVFKTTLLVAADGRSSTTRALAGIATRVKDYGQQAQQWRLVHEIAHNNTAYEILLPTGPYVVLPSAEANQSRLIWCIAAEDVADPETALAAHFPQALGSIRETESLGQIPLNLQQAKSGYRGRVVLIGDAYLRVHPVAAQGLNLGFRDAAALAQKVIEAERSGLDHGCATLLRAYQRERCQDRFLVRNLTDFLGNHAGAAARLPFPSRVLSRLLGTRAVRRLIQKAFHGE